MLPGTITPAVAVSLPREQINISVPMMSKQDHHHPWGQWHHLPLSPSAIESVALAPSSLGQRTVNDLYALLEVWWANMEQTRWAAERRKSRPTRGVRWYDITRVQKDKKRQVVNLMHIPLHVISNPAALSADEFCPVSSYCTGDRGCCVPPLRANPERADR